MFLDDKVLQMCQQRAIKNPEQIQQLYVDVQTEFEKHYKSNLKEGMTNKEMKVVIDHTFNLYDSFVRLCLKSKDHQLKILGTLFKENTFKMQFMKNKAAADAYSNLV